MKIDEKVGLCPYPFGRIEIKHDRFTTCCEHWTSDEFRELAIKSPGWNGEAAKELRKKLINQDYSFCKLDVCGMEPMSIADFKKRGGKFSPFNHISEKNLAAVENGENSLPEGPAVVVISADRRCNLKCPSCRKDYITKLDPYQEAAIANTQDFIEKNKQYIQSVRFNDGEPLFSPWMRSIIKSFSKEKFPRLKHVCLLTNANLLNEKGVRDLYPGFEFIDELSLSIDAGDEETYAAVRGGDFNQVLKNIEWALKELTHVRALDTTFVLQKNNYKSLPRFIEIMEGFGVNEVIIRELHDWGGMKLNYKENAVHHPDHPEHQQFLEVLNSLPRFSRTYVPPILTKLIQS